jgi:antitoxin YefM
METLPLAEAKDKLSAITNEITTTHVHYTITRNGKPVVVMLPVEDLEALEETIFWLQRELAQLRADDREPDGPDTSGEEMAELIEQRRREMGSA